MLKKIGFVCGVSQSNRLMYALSQELQKNYEVEPLYIFFQKNVEQYLTDRGVSAERMINPQKNFVYGQWSGEKVDMEYLKEIEKAYGIPNLWLMWETIRNHQKNHTLYNALKLLETVFSTYESFADTHKFDAVITHVYPGTIPSFALSNILSLRNIPVYTIFPHRIAGRFVMYTGYKDKYEKIDKIFEELQKRKLTDEERTLAEEFLTKFREKRYFSTQEKLVVNKKEFSFVRIRRAMRGLYDSYRYKTYKTLRNTNPLGPLIYIKNRLYSMIKRRILNLSKIFEQPDYGEKYVLYFLHKQPENSTLAKAPFYLDQVNLILNISKSLPIDYRLYVKPHHNDFGNQKLSYYKNLSQRPNIRLLSVKTNGHELIKNSDIIITITGSVGWEGILFEKPVFAFGNVFYNSFPLVEQVSDIKELPDLIRKAIDSFKLDHELLLKYIVAHYSGSYEGTPIAPALDEHTSLNAQNIYNIAEGIAKELQLSRKN